MNSSEDFDGNYKHRLRVRVCGVLIEDGRLLLVRHRFPNGKVLYIPPGGGQEYGESAEGALQKEFKEETGLVVDVGGLLLVHEFKELPLHAMELFFTVNKLGGRLTTGRDPETREQIIEEVGFYDAEAIHRIPRSQRHQILRNFTTMDSLLGLGRYLRSGR